MQISNNFNRLYHSVLGDFWKQATAARLNINNFEKFKDGLKELNNDYPREDGKPISTTKITAKDLCRHLEFVIDFAAYYGFKLRFIEDEWQRLINTTRA